MNVRHPDASIRLPFRNSGARWYFSGFIHEKNEIIIFLIMNPNRKETRINMSPKIFSREGLKNKAITGNATSRA
ncbi:hypothetical protein A2331_04820 [Candidatus Falkowbacteria bacterium RIFOXYB2_FULL_34_18]|nr:MAG: hypothetical protein A2331_04820 [Candidatus Falkowbacteria bacterium RIFOXYB2_FULL_34_18]OGF28857.1 MAG: hypothetical protein A2500_00555 [Candidatus Falkowbacteria bacterium RIFOXYC12_FULL_34_55]OGF35770.1 MAG: hypothetical protein A2466_04515 [Candidatus Falkowbacteria bacterium RIFOXYC2_FULL_34_220]OGF38436.1 MAG: hypothetical protein A2515_01955 [Candidatus Falkowbacteria bacterium RIFOXYD12_FULL_34_57]